MKRFANACDVRKAYPTRRELTTDEILNINLDPKCLNRLESSQPVKDMSHLIETTKTRLTNLSKVGNKLTCRYAAHGLAKRNL